jgi:hypothetical protein
MNNYLNNIIPRLKRYSSSLNKKEIFIDKPWIFIDGKGNEHEYIFMRDGRLLMSLNGDVTEGKWELLPNEKLLVNRITDQIMLQNMFVDDALMALQKSGSDEEPFVLVNKKRIPDLDTLKYLKRLDEIKVIDETNKEGKSVVLESGIIIGHNFYKGKHIECFDGSLVSGVFRSDRKSVEEYVVVKSGVVDEVYYLCHYSADGRDITIRQTVQNHLNSGDRIMDFEESGIVTDSLKIRYKAKDGGHVYPYNISLNEKGIITKVHDPELVFILFFFGIIIAIIVVVIAVAYAHENANRI